MDVLTFDGTILGSISYSQLTIPANGRRTERVSILLPLPLNLNTTYARVTLNNVNTGALVHTSNFYFTKPIYLTLPKPNMNVTCDTPSNSCSFTTTNYASNVYLELSNSDDTTLRLSENFFDLTPCMPPVVVKILSNHTLAGISSQLKISTLYDTYN